MGVHTVGVARRMEQRIGEGRGTGQRGATNETGGSFGWAGRGSRNVAKRSGAAGRGGRLQHKPQPASPAAVGHESGWVGHARGVGWRCAPRGSRPVGAVIVGLRAQKSGTG